MSDIINFEENKVNLYFKNKSFDNLIFRYSELFSIRHLRRLTTGEKWEYNQLIIYFSKNSNNEEAKKNFQEILDAYDRNNLWQEL